MDIGNIIAWIIRRKKTLLMHIQKYYGCMKAAFYILSIWNVVEKIFDLKKKSPLDGALLELKNGGDPCSCRELGIA